MKKDYFQFGHCSSPCALKSCSKIRVVQVLLISYCCSSGHHSFQHLTSVINDLKQNFFLFLPYSRKKINSVSGLFRLFCRGLVVGFFLCSSKIYSEETGKYSASPRQAIRKFRIRNSDFNRHLGRNNFYCC